MYIRFVVASHDENPWRATGIITSARVLCDDGELEPYEAEIVQSSFDWFNDHLPCPPFGANRKSGAWTVDAVAWFVPEAKEPIARMWDLVAILKEHGVAVQIFRSESPGLIVYRDEYQVVAETPRRA
jgi:hypothetical protein